LTKRKSKSKSKSKSAEVEAPEEEEYNPKGGAPMGNFNAMKHGFYSKRFRRQEVRDLLFDDQLSLRSEAQLLRVVMRRTVERCMDSEDPKDYISLLRAVTDGSYGVSRLMKAEMIVGEHPLDHLDDLLKEALHNIREELNLPDDLTNFESMDEVIGRDGKPLGWLQPPKGIDLDQTLRLAFYNWLWEQEPETLAKLRRERHEARQMLAQTNKVFTAEGLRGG
jgi:hypothetical protein